jgi:pimeloyl-ACP methyl ester carboxylesterase
MGYGGSLRIWPLPFIEALAETFDVITYDNRGTGKSIVPKEPEEYTAAKMAADAEDVVKHFALSRLSVLGFSMGGCIALEYALNYPERVQALFLLSTTAGGSSYARPDRALSETLANPPGKTLYDMYMATFELMYSPQAFARCKPSLEAIYENSSECPTTPTGLRGHSNAFKTFDATQRLFQLRMPVTVMCGLDDRLMPAENSRNLAAAIPQANLVLLPDCEHGPHIQEQQRVVDEIKKLCAPASIV